MSGTSTSERLRPATREDHAAVVGLLRSEGLPTVDLPSDLEGFVVLLIEGDMAAVGGLESYGDDVLVRSVAVRPESRGRGLGARVVDALLAIAKERGAQAGYLLTMSAAGFFQRRGFEVVERDDVPPAVASSREFAELCPDSATAMRIQIGGS